MTEKSENNVVPKGTVKLHKRKSKKWNEDRLKLTTRKYVVPHVNTISLAESQRFIALHIESHPLLPEEYVVVRT